MKFVHLSVPVLPRTKPNSGIRRRSRSSQLGCPRWFELSGGTGGGIIEMCYLYAPP